MIPIEKKPPRRALKMILMGLCLSAGLAVSVTGCYHFSSNGNTADVMLAPNKSRMHLVDSSRRCYVGLFSGSSAFHFYKSHGFNPIWSVDSEKSALADSLIQIIKRSRYYGLLPQDYRLAEIERLIENAPNYTEEYHTSRFDLLLTNAFFAIASHLKHGRISADSVKRYQAPPNDSILCSLLEIALTKNDVRKVLESQEPVSREYNILKTSLKNTLNDTDSITRSILLAGDIIDSLMISAKVFALEINMERWRWEKDLQGRYVVVNIPAFSMQVVEDDSVVFQSKVIIGTAKNATPLLDGIIRSFTIFPYWNVPRNIAVKEILPNLKKDPLYFSAHHYNLLNPKGNVIDHSTIDWSIYHENNFPFMIRQSEGFYNSLGLIKFSFNNPYSVYLHDTNSRLLFNREFRALSHGCVRVERALEFGRYLVSKNNPICTPDDLDQYLELRKQLVIRVPEPLPVHIRYFTCRYEEGEIRFYKDIYLKDQELMGILYQLGALGERI